MVAGSLCGGCTMWWLGHCVVGHCVVGHSVVGALCGGYAMVGNVPNPARMPVNQSRSQSQDRKSSTY